MNAIKQDPNVLDLLVWKKGMADWQPLKTLSEFATITSGECPPPIPE
jgi:hypothetical protein